MIAVRHFGRRRAFSWLLWTAVSLAMAIFVGQSQAWADMYIKLVRITCVPEASYAAVETFGLYNIGSDQRAALAAQGAYELGVLVENPVACELPQGKLQIEIFNYHEPQAQGNCGAVEDADLRISLAGTELTVAKGTHGGCTGFQQHEIRISKYALQHCITQLDRPFEVVNSEEFTSAEAQCKSILFKQ